MTFIIKSRTLSLKRSIDFFFLKLRDQIWNYICTSICFLNNNVELKCVKKWKFNLQEKKWSRWLCEFARATVTKHHDTLCGINNRNLFSSLFWKLKVQNQGVGRVYSFWRLCGKDLFQACLLVDGHLYVHTAFSLYLCPNFPFLDASRCRLWPT